MAFKSPLRGVQVWRRRQAFALEGAAATYAQKVLSYGPIAYWPLWETSGASAQCLVNSTQNGTYNGVSLANDITPMGTPAPYFDAVASYVNVFTATLAGSFTGNLNTVVVWARVVNVGAWTDGVSRDATRFRFTAAGGYLRIFKTNAANALQWTRYDGVGAQNVGTGGHSDTDWMCLIHTTTVAGNQFMGYKDGSQENGTQVGLGNMGAALDQAWIGVQASPATAPWQGWLSHCIVFNRVLTSAEIINLAVP